MCLLVAAVAHSLIARSSVGGVVSVHRGGIGAGAQVLARVRVLVRGLICLHLEQMRERVAVVHSAVVQRVVHLLLQSPA